MQCLNNLSVILFSIIYTSVVNSEPCEQELDGCLKTRLQSSIVNFANGIPELGVETLDPFVVDKLELTLAGGLKIQFNKGQARGLKKCIVESARLVKDKLETQFLCNITTKGHYTSKGRLITFPINGDGESSIKCRNLRLNNVLKLRSVDNGNGIKYLEIVSSKSTHSYDGRITYNMTNLFKGSPETSKLVLDFMNQNWRMVAQEFGDPIVEFGVNTIIKNVKKMISALPIENFFTLPVDF